MTVPPSPPSRRHHRHGRYRPRPRTGRHRTRRKGDPRRRSLMWIWSGAQAFAAAIRCRRALTPMPASLFESGELDLVHICTPPQSHVLLALQAHDGRRRGARREADRAEPARNGSCSSLSERETGVPVLTVFQHRFGAGRPADSATLADSGVLGPPPRRHLRDACGTATTPTSLSRGEVAGTSKAADRRWATASTSSICLLAVLGPWSRVSAFAARQSPARPIPRTCRSRSPTSRTARLPRSSTRVRLAATRRRACGSTTSSPRSEVEHLCGYTNEDWTFTPAPGHEHLAARWADSTGG